MDDLLNIALSNAVAATALAFVAVAAGALWRRPALVHGLWLLVLLKLVTPPLVRIPIAWPATSQSSQVDVAASAVEEPAPETTSSLPEQPAFVLVLPATAEDEPAVPPPTTTVPPAPTPADPPLWPRLLPLAWLAGSLGWFVLALLRLGQFRHLLRFARAAPAALQERTARLSRRLGLQCCPRVGLLPGRLAPMLWAIGGEPRLLVPAGLLDVLGDEQLDTLLVHELAHLRRRDHWVRALELVVMGLYWWHPVVWYARRELREAEEQCCDAWVVSTLPGAGRTYATALMDTLDFLSTARPVVPPLASGIGHVSDLKRRFTMIMRGTTPRALSWPGCLAMLALGAFFLPLLPALQAQEPSKEDIKKQLLDEQNAQGKLDAAKADMDKLKAALKAKMAEVEAAKAALQAAAKDLRDHEMKLDALKRAQRDLPPKGGDLKEKQVRIEKDSDPKKTQIRIEIVASPDTKADDLKDLLKRSIEGLATEKNVHVIFRVEDVLKGVKLEHHQPAQLQHFAPQAPPVPKPQKYGEQRTIPLPPGPAQDKRINDLEKKLEKVLRELEELRKQMKEPRSGLEPSADVVVPNFRFRIEPPATPPSPPAAPKPPSLPGAPKQP